MALFGPSKKELEKREAEITEFVEFTGGHERAREMYERARDRLTVSEMKERWTAVEEYGEALTEYWDKKEYFDKKLATIPKLLKKPTVKSLAKAVLIQQEYITHIQQRFVTNRLGMLRDKDMPIDPTSIFGKLS